MKIEIECDVPEGLEYFGKTIRLPGADANTIDGKRVHAVGVILGEKRREPRPGEVWGDAIMANTEHLVCGGGIVGLSVRMNTGELGRNSEWPKSFVFLAASVEEWARIKYECARCSVARITADIQKEAAAKGEAVQREEFIRGVEAARDKCRAEQPQRDAIQGKREKIAADMALRSAKRIGDFFVENARPRSASEPCTLNRCDDATHVHAGPWRRDQCDECKDEDRAMEERVKKALDDMGKCAHSVKRDGLKG
jgi:hypothetical protein